MKLAKQRKRYYGLRAEIIRWHPYWKSIKREANKDTAKFRSDIKYGKLGKALAQKIKSCTFLDKAVTGDELMDILRSHESNGN